MTPQQLAKLCTSAVLRKTGITLSTRRNWREGRPRKVHPAYVVAVVEAYHATARDEK
jgi:hypothetical protein